MRSQGQAEQHAEQVPLEIVATGRAQQLSAGSGAEHAQRQEDGRQRQGAAAGLLAVVLGVHGLDFEHGGSAGMPWGRQKCPITFAPSSPAQ